MSALTVSPEASIRDPLELLGNSSWQATRHALQALPDGRSAPQIDIGRGDETMAKRFEDRTDAGRQLAAR